MRKIFLSVLVDYCNFSTAVHGDPGIVRGHGVTNYYCRKKCCDRTHTMPVFQVDISVSDPVLGFGDTQCSFSIPVYNSLSLKLVKFDKVYLALETLTGRLLSFPVPAPSAVTNDVGKPLVLALWAGAGGLD
jgi:hypothetical protein